jgi:hypothetical protein
VNPDDTNTETIPRDGQAAPAPAAPFTSAQIKPPVSAELYAWLEARFIAMNAAACMLAEDSGKLRIQLRAGILEADSRLEQINRLNREKDELARQVLSCRNIICELNEMICCRDEQIAEL